MAEQCQVHIAGVGTYMPRKVTINEDFNYSAHDVNPMWVQFSGYKSRRVADSYETTVTMATEAAADALDMAGLDPKQVELLIFVNGTFDAESVCPAGAPKIAADLGAENALAISMRDGCHGFIFGMEMAAKMIQAGVYRHVLVVSSEIFSRHVDTSVKNNLRLGMAMGDGAGAVVLSAGTEDGPGLLGSFAATRADMPRSVAMQAKTIFSLKDGMQSGLFFCFLNSRDSRRDSRNSEKIETDFDRLKEMTLKIVPLAVNSALENAGVSKQDVDLFIFHQPNRMFLEEWRERLGIPKNKVFDTLEQYGNLSNSAVPVNLFEALKQGLVKPGSTVCLAAMGEGTGYGAQVWKWTKSTPHTVPGPVSASLRHEGRLRRELCNIDKFSAKELWEDYIKPGHSETISWGRAHGQYVNVHGFAEGVPTDKAYEYIQEIVNLEEWTMSVRNVRPMPDLQGRKRYQAEDSLAPGGTIYFLENKVPETKLVEWWVGHSPEDIWMYYCMRVLDGQEIMGRPGSVITWVNFSHANFARNEMLSKGFTLMPVAHGIERDNLLKILVHKFGTGRG